MIEEIHSLKIAVLGYNMTQTNYAMKYLMQNNYDEIDIENSNIKTIRFKDGTIFFSIDLTHDIRSKQFDQLFLFDDNRWNIKNKYDNEIKLIKLYCMRNSYVPEEFQVVEYENILD